MTNAIGIGDRILAFSLENGYRSLLFSLVMILLAYPIVMDYASGRFLLDVFVSLVMITSLMAAVKTPGSLRIGLFLLVVLLAARWAEAATGAPALIFFSMVITAIFWSYVVVEILIDIFVHRKEVTADMIFGSLSVYLLIGLVFAFFYTILDVLVPNSFDGMSFIIADQGHREFHRFVYYSFVTITTLGYGDLLPIMPASRALAYMEATLGQVYLAVLVARLVGMYVAPKNQ